MKGNISFTESSPYIVDIFYFFDPFCNDCLEMEPMINKLVIEYESHIRIRKILTPSLQVLTKCQAQSTSDIDNIALAYKAAEFQGRTKASRFMRHVLNRIVPNRHICTEGFIRESAALAGLDLNTFIEDIKSVEVKTMLKRDLAVYREMDIKQNPSLVFYSGDIYQEGVKLDGLYPYHIITYVINELLDVEIEKRALPSIYAYIERYEIVSFYELEQVFEWRPEVLLNELNKLRLKQLIETVETERGIFYKLYGAKSLSR